ncbi:hypothetical protein [Streptomyces hirsutus]|uniref:hypothetical protein n=1 Tax=Streptomyces hirsutus TaxID=35620 RepID=UPI00365B6DDE
MTAHPTPENAGHWYTGRCEGAHPHQVDDSEATAPDVVHPDVSPLADDLQQVWVLPDGATDWQHVGYTTEPIIGIDYGAADPGESAVITWPHRYGKTAALRSVTVEAPLTGDTRALFDALLAGHRAHLDRRLRRLATDLGRWVPHVRHDFHKVQHVLEEAGIGDGYGRLTIPQPVRPPIEQPAGRWLP